MTGILLVIATLMSGIVTHISCILRPNGQINGRMCKGEKFLILRGRALCSSFCKCVLASGRPPYLVGMFVFFR